MSVGVRFPCSGTHSIVPPPFPVHCRLELASSLTRAALPIWPNTLPPQCRSLEQRKHFSGRFRDVLCSPCSMHSCDIRIVFWHIDRACVESCGVRLTLYLVVAVR